MSRVPFYPARPFTSPGASGQAVFANWACEPKANGWRFLYNPETGECWNRKGSPFTQAVLPIEQWYGAKECWLDCELLGRRTKSGAGSVLVIDCILKGGDTAPYAERRLRYENLPEIPYDDIPTNALMRFPSFAHSEALAEIETMKEVNALRNEVVWEGLVLKHPRSTYPIQRRSPDTETRYWGKCRFI